MTEDSLEALRAEFERLANRVRQLETLGAEQKGALEREMRGAFEEMRGAFGGVAARFDGLKSELRYGLEQIDARMERIEGMLRRALNGGSIAPS